MALVPSSHRLAPGSVSVQGWEGAGSVVFIVPAEREVWDFGEPWEKLPVTGSLLLHWVGTNLGFSCRLGGRNVSSGIEPIRGRNVSFKVEPISLIPN